MRWQDSLFNFSCSYLLFPVPIRMPHLSRLWDSPFTRLFFIDCFSAKLYMNSKITFIKILVFQNFFKKLKVKILDDYMHKTYFPSSCLVLLFTRNNVLQRRDSKFLLGSNYQDTNFTLTLLFDVYTSHYGCNSEALRCIFIPLYRYVHLNLNTQKFS